MKKTNSKKTRQISIRTELLLLVILPVVLVTVILFLISINSMNEGMVSPRDTTAMLPYVMAM